MCGKFQNVFFYHGGMTENNAFLRFSVTLPITPPCLLVNTLSNTLSSTHHEFKAAFQMLPVPADNLSFQILLYVSVF